MRVVAWVGFVACCLLASGCSLFGKKAPATANPAGQARNDRGAAAPADRAALPDRTAPPPDLGGILAGQVLDSFNRRPTASFIQVTELGPGAAGGAATIDVAADSQGYFTIQGLKPGRHYQLTARAREGGRLLAGTAFATPPNPKLLIHISEDFVSPNTPPVPGAPAVPGKAPAAPADSKDKDQEKPKAKEQAWIPGRDPADGPVGASIATPRTPARGAELGAPESGTVAPAAANPAPPTPQARANPNLTNIPPQVPPDGFARVPAAPPTAPPAAPASPARVPSCDLTGKTLTNFALNDLNGQPYEFRRHRTGKLVLLDFWRTDCIPCQYAIRHLTILRDRYGPYGLEILGIAYETGTPREQVLRVDRIRQRLGINYRLLLGGGAQCPVRTQFGVQAFPTLVLLDETNRIVWRSEGWDKHRAEDLEHLIQQRLGVP